MKTIIEEGIKSFIVEKTIFDEEKQQWHLYIDAIYKCLPEQSKNLSGDILSKMFPVGVLGGFRVKGKTDEPRMIILTTSGEDIYWKDELDTATGNLIYYGDNKTPGTDLHSTKLSGNKILRDMFANACSYEFDDRIKIPPIFVFKKASGRDMKFLGLAVPGIKSRPQKEWLTAVWGCNKDGDRFQNYKAIFTILDTSAGSRAEYGEAGINLAWVNDIANGKAYESKYAPQAWKDYISNSKFNSLMAKVEKTSSTKEEQLPKNKLQMQMLEVIQNYFIEKDNGYSFEKFASDIIVSMDEKVVNIETTRPYKDGGVDGEGRYRIFEYSDNRVEVDFYMQAKCYSINNPVGVKDMARLISRIKDRQFGIMITTSYVAMQAYQELLEDGHPIVIINGRKIIEFIFYKLEINSLEKLVEWLKRNY